jgi:enediyne biosynthesis protein E4
MINILRYGLFYALIALVCSCAEKKTDTVFRSVKPEESGILFSNDLKETVEFNIFNYLYFYNGGGVATGDVNGDGQLDIYFTANQKQNKLYINQGDLRFKDVTDEAGVAGADGWKTGVTMADVDGDGKLDIYVSYLGDYLSYRGKNLLFINLGNDETGNPKFEERGAEFGLDLVGFSTQAAFFDYDRDGDLDMFMLTHSVHGNGTFANSSLRKKTHALAGDRLMRNDNGKFSDVTGESGIYSSALGYGLGVAVSDVNLDGWPDVYVGNDFHENDYLYLNQGNGTFKEVLEQQMMHTSRYTMGVDFADFNNDGFPDLIAMDMLPDDQQRLKASMAEDPYDVYKFKQSFGYNHQFTRNTLQINNRNGTFSDVGLMAGVAATDWSWASFFADFDLDGNKDIFVSNGILRRSNDLDYINFIEVDSIQRRMAPQGMSQRELKLIQKMPKVKIPNYLFINNGDSTFRNVAEEWGMGMPTCSQGAAYADLDNDGDLDLVVNNMDEVASLFENNTIKTLERVTTDSATTRNRFLQVTLKGSGKNPFGIGAKIFIYQGGSLQAQECMPTRGFQSSVDYRLTFGLGSKNQIDSLVVVWPDGKFQRVDSIAADQRMSLEEKNAKGSFNYDRFHFKRPFFNRAAIGLPYVHEENAFTEFDREPLIPHMLSAEGPAVAIADVNGDRRDDIFLSNGKRKPAHLYVQQTDRTFVESSKELFENDAMYEDTGAEFLDADGDGDNDLLLAAGGNEFFGKSPFRKPRLHLNDGKGNFSQSNLLPEIYLTASCVKLADVDGDNDLDAFVGGRAVPWIYGKRADSYLLVNNGNKFLNETDRVAPALKDFGFVTDARWADIDGDGDQDLIIAAEWRPITILINDRGRLQRLPEAGSGLENTNGWWQCVEVADLDSDGDADMLFGNMGLNSKFVATQEHPVKMYVGDFDNNDSIDQVLTHWMGGKEYPFHTRDEMTKQMPYLKKRYLSYQKFSEATAEDMFTREQLMNAQQFIAYTFASVWVENLGNNKFSVHPLPHAAQISTVKSFLVSDYDRDGAIDVLLAGNLHRINIQMGRHDASYGLWLKGLKSGGFKAMPAVESGFSVKGEVRALRSLNIGGKVYYLAIRNNDTIEAFTTNH